MRSDLKTRGQGGIKGSFVMVTSKQSGRKGYNVLLLPFLPPSFFFLNKTFLKKLKMDFLKPDLRSSIAGSWQNM